MTRGGGGAGGWGELVVPSGDLAGKWTSPTILSEGEFVRETCLSPPPPPHLNYPLILPLCTVAAT